MKIVYCLLIVALNVVVSSWEGLEDWLVSVRVGGADGVVLDFVSQLGVDGAKDGWFVPVVIEVGFEQSAVVATANGVSIEEE